MTEFTPLSSLIGGALIGLSATLMLLFNGRIAGISGIIGGCFPVGDRGWRLLFILPMFFVGAIAGFVTPTSFGDGDLPGYGALAAAGLLVGIGTRMGSGCTSGHGVCGLPRLAPRSMAATGTFMGAGILTVTVLRHVFGWS